MMNVVLQKKDIQTLYECYWVDLSYIKEPHNKIRMRFKLSVLEHCCGIFELGCLSLEEGLPQEAFDLFFKDFLRKNLTFMINTNGKGASLLFEDLLENCPYFTKVKSFKNYNSGNTVTIWISNN